MRDTHDRIARMSSSLFMSEYLLQAKLDNKFDEGDSLDEVQHKDGQEKHSRGPGAGPQSRAQGHGRLLEKHC